jgi:hypothetical protein
MDTRKRGTSKAKSVIAIIPIFVLFLVSVTHAGSVSVSGRSNYHITMAKGAKVDDISGHTVGIGEARGLTAFDDGEIATFYGVFTFDYIKGTGKFRAYITNTFDDGSTRVYVVDNGETTALQGGKISRIRGKYTFIKGTGRFAGIKGGGVMTGKRITPLSAGADCYSDFNETFTLP